MISTDSLESNSSITSRLSSKTFEQKMAAVLKAQEQDMQLLPANDTAMAMSQVDGACD